MIPDQLDLDDLRPHLLVPLQEHQEVQLVQELTKGFTSEREKLKAKQSYFHHPESVSAYGLFYFPTNILKFNYVLNRLPAHFKDSFFQSEFIDIGTGPGTYALAFANCLKKRNINGVVYGLDESVLMLKQAENFARGFSLDNCQWLKTDFIPSNDNPKTLCFGHSLNEIGADRSLALVKKFDPLFLLFIEPGTPAVFQELLKLRSVLASMGYKSIYPCHSLEAPCPLIKQNKEDWCHQIIHSKLPFNIARFCQKVGLDRAHMPVTIHLYKKVRSTELKSEHRVITRYFGENKFSWRFQTCGGSEFKTNELQKIIFMKKKHKEHKKLFENLYPGDLIHYNLIDRGPKGPESDGDQEAIIS